MPNSFRLAACLLLPFLAACAVSPAPTSTTAMVPTPAVTQRLSLPATPPTLPTRPLSTITLTPEPALPTLTSLPDLPICSPLPGISLSQIDEMISNPYHPPQPGSDDPHQGVDLADRLPDSQVAVAGRAVQAVLGGQVAAVIQDRFPYGSALLIETPLQEPMSARWNAMAIPTAAPTLALVSPLTCPPAPQIAFSGSSQRSLYLLYAHLEHPSTHVLGDPVTCGEIIGAIGSSGNAINPHLHFEVRVGPSGLRLDSMAHYDASASTEEMGAYCLWRISGLFQLVDPLQLLRQQPPP